MNIPNRSQFPRAGEVAYLDTAAEGLPLQDSLEALEAYYEAKSRGTPGRRELYRAEAEAIQAAASLLNSAPETVALLSSASEGFNLLANSIDWRTGDEVLITDLEFASNVVAWLRLREKGVRVNVVQSEAGTLRLEQFTSQLTSATRLVSVSQVSYKTGTRLPFVPELSREAHNAGAILCLDATQGLGRMPVDTEGVDFLVASTYKWLLGVHGLGVIYFSPELQERLTPAAAGWYSIKNLFRADRFEQFTLKDGAARLVTGMPNFPSIYVLRQSLEYLLEVGVDRIESSLRPLIAKLRHGLADMDLDLLTPPGAEYASGIVSFAHPEAERIGAALDELGVVVWSGDGRVRASMHLYNDEDDIKALLAALGAILHRSVPANA